MNPASPFSLALRLLCGAIAAALLAVAAPVRADCSPDVGKVGFNEVNLPASGTPFMELKIRDGSILPSSIGSWKIKAYESTTGSEQTVQVSAGTSSSSTCGNSSLWIRFTSAEIPLLASPDTFPFNFVLFDANDKIVDILRLGTDNNVTSIYATPTNRCPLIENALPATGTTDTLYDAERGSTGNKDWWRTPDGTGPWSGKGTSNPGNTSCGSNDTNSGGTFGVAKVPSTTVTPTGTTFDYTLYAVNGSTTVTSPASVVITDDLPSGLTCSSCTTSVGSCACTTSQKATWTVGSVPASVAYTATVTVNAVTAGSYSNTAVSNVGTSPFVKGDAPTVTVFAPPVNYMLDESSWSNGGTVSGTIISGTLILNSGSTAASAAGKVCTSLDVNLGLGSGISVANNSVLDINANGGTISFWINPDSATKRYLFSKTTDYFAYLDASGKLVFGWGAASGALTPRVTSTATIATSTWTHVTLVYDKSGSKALIYLNGELDNSAAVTAAPGTGSGSLLIGSLDQTTYTSNPLTGYTGYDGRLEEFKIFKAALTDANIWYIYLKENAGLNYDGTTRTCAGGLDHIRVYLDNNTGALTCSPRSVSAIACANPTCTSRYAASTSVTLNPGGTAATIAANGTGTPSVATVTAGSASITLNTSTPTPAGTPNFRCYSGTIATPGSEITGSCNVTFSNAGLFVNVPHHRSCDSQTLTITAAKTDDTTKKCVPAFDSGALRDIKLRFAYSSPGSGSVVPTVGSALPPTTTLATGSDQTLSLAFTGGIATTNFRYQDAGSLTITAAYSGSAGTGDAGLTMGTVLGNASYLNPFVVAPQNFVLSGIPAAPLVAGSSFNVTVTAMNNCSPAAATQNFAGTVVLSSSNPLPGIGNATAISQNITVSSGGTASANATWNEVGTIDLTGTTTNYLSSGLNVTSSATTAGRFKPAYFDTVVTPGCASSFTYTGLSGVSPVAGQPFTVEVKAKRFGANATDATNTSNYAGATWAQAVLLSDANAGGGTLNNGSFAATAFASGKASRNDVNYAIASKTTAPYTLAIRAIDADTPAVSSSGHTEGSTVTRSGRLRLQNANGSELLPLPLPIAVQYYESDAKAWQTSTGDTCSTLAAANFAFNFPVSSSNQLSACETAVTVSGSPPSQSIILSRPGSGNNGWTDITINLGATSSGNQCSATGAAGPASVPAAKAWLQYDWQGAGATDPKARATFGVYRSGPVLHRREAY